MIPGPGPVAGEGAGRGLAALVGVWRMWIAGVLLVAAGCEAEVRAQVREARTDFPCYEKARDETTLSREQALFLCRGARALGPVDCFAEGDDETTLSDVALIRLCRCAESVEPVRCFDRANRETLLTDEQIIETCRPIRANRLTPTCVPIRAL